jgi:hypothetical protein
VLGGIGKSSSRDAALSSEASSHACQGSAPAKTTGMRPWIALAISFAWQVMIVQLRTTSPSGEVQGVHSPAKQNSSTSASETCSGRFGWRGSSGR